MKIRIFSVLLLAAVCFTLFTGCSAVNALQQLDRAEEVIEHRLDVAEDKLERRIEAAVPKAQAPDTAPTQTAANVKQITKEDAVSIALQHAGLSANDVRGLRVEFDYDDGRPEYDVDFRSGGYEYDYEIHAETGDIITWDKELDD